MITNHALWQVPQKKEEFPQHQYVYLLLLLHFFFLSDHHHRHHLKANKTVEVSLNHPRCAILLLPMSSRPPILDAAQSRGTRVISFIIFSGWGCCCCCFYVHLCLRIFCFYVCFCVFVLFLRMSVWFVFIYVLG